MLSRHNLMARLLAALVLLALVAIPPVALAMPTGATPAAGTTTAAGQSSDCPDHHGAQAAKPAHMPLKAGEHPCKGGCAACASCIFVQAALLPSATMQYVRVAAVFLRTDVPPLRLTRRSHPPLRPPSI